MVPPQVAHPFPGWIHKPAQNVILIPIGYPYCTPMTDSRKLIDLVSVGPATVADFDELGITKVRQLVGKDASKLFIRLQRIRGQKLDPCCQDVFQAAIEQARNPRLSKEKRNWYYWSRVRKTDSR